MSIRADILNKLIRIGIRISFVRSYLYKMALKRKLRGSKLGRMTLANLNSIMEERTYYHDEVAKQNNILDYTKVFWESDFGYLWYDRTFGKQNSNVYFKFAMEKIITNNYTSFLDVGCGWGELCSLVSQIPHMKRVVGIDVSADVVLQASKRNKKSNIEFFHKNLFDLNDNSDIVTCIGVIDYVTAAEVRDFLVKLITVAKHEVIIVNSLRKIPFDASLLLSESKKILLYDEGYVHPLNRILESLKVLYNFKFSIEKYGSDSVLVNVIKL